MPPHAEVRQEWIDTYAREGAVRIPGIFRAWIGPLLEAHDRLQERLAAVAEPSPFGGVWARIAGDPAYPPLSYQNSGKGAFGIRNAAFHDPTFANWLHNSPAASVIGQVIGASRLHYWWDQSFCKDQSGEEGVSEWHTDSGSFSWAGDMLPSVWIAGTDVPMDNAPLVTVVGSHKDKRWFRPVMGRDDVADMGENYAERSEILKVVADPATQTRTWQCEAGDLLLIHPFTYHASVPRKASAGRRIAFTSRWLGDDIVWKKRPMTFDYPDDPRFHSVRQDAPPPEDGFPVMWHRGAAN